MIVVRELRHVGEQGSIYIRYRCCVTVRVSETSSDPYENSRMVFARQVGARMSGI
jgi:hypothetical protein